MKRIELDQKDYWWYLELKKYGTVPHSGFGAGFERLVQFVSGMENIRIKPVILNKGIVHMSSAYVIFGNRIPVFQRLPENDKKTYCRTIEITLLAVGLILLFSGIFLLTREPLQGLESLGGLASLISGSVLLLLYCSCRDNRRLNEIPPVHFHSYPSTPPYLPPPPFIEEVTHRDVYLLPSQPRPHHQSHYPSQHHLPPQPHSRPHHPPQPPPHYPHYHSQPQPHLPPQPPSRSHPRHPSLLVEDDY